MFPQVLRLFSEAPGVEIRGFKGKFVISVSKKKEYFIFDVPQSRYMQKFMAILSGATISPYLAPWTGLWPKYFSETNVKQKLKFNPTHFCHLKAGDKPLLLTPNGDGFA